MSYQLVSESEADMKSGKISVASPIAKGLLGQKGWRNNRNYCTRR